MEIGEFIKQDRGPYAFDFWQWTHRVQTAAGDFVVELQMLGDNDTAAPDRYMIERAEALARFAREQGDYILDIVYAHYRAASSEYWLKICDVPEGLRRDQVMSYVSDLSLVVARHLDWEHPYESRIYISPAWDEEHAIHLTFEDGKLTRLNDQPFELVEGVLTVTYE